MFKVNNLWPLKFAQPLTQLLFLWKCWHPNQPITVEKRLYLIISQIPRYFDYIWYTIYISYRNNPLYVLVLVFLGVPMAVL